MDDNMKFIELTVTWLRDQAINLDYGEVIIRVIIHNGRVRRIEKTVTEREQPDSDLQH